MADNELYLVRINVNPEHCSFQLKDDSGREILAYSKNCNGNLDRVDVNPFGPRGESTPSEAVDVINDFFSADAPEENKKEWEALKAAVGIPIGERKDRNVNTNLAWNNPRYYSIFKGDCYLLDLSSDGRPVQIASYPEARHTSFEYAEPAFQGLVNLLEGMSEYDNTKVE